MMNLFQLKERLDSAGALITFSGSFSHTIIEELGTAVRKYLESEEVQKSSLMDVFSVYVEAAQNVRNYTAGKEGDSTIANSSILVIAKRDQRYEVHAGNLVDNADIPGFTARIQALVGVDKAGLKALYKEQLRKERPPGAVGAGLGLIDMARRATQPLEFEFTPVDAEHSFFSLRVVV